MYNDYLDKLSRNPASEDAGFEVAPVNFKVENATPISAQTTTPAPNVASEGSKALGTAGAFAINPYLGGAALGLQALGMISQSKQHDEELAYQAKLQKISSIQNSLNQLSQTGMGLGRL